MLTVLAQTPGSKSGQHEERQPLAPVTVDSSRTHRREFSFAPGDDAAAITQENQKVKPKKKRPIVETRSSRTPSEDTEALSPATVKSITPTESSSKRGGYFVPSAGLQSTLLGTDQRSIQGQRTPSSGSNITTPPQGSRIPTPVRQSEVFRPATDFALAAARAAKGSRASAEHKPKAGK